MEKPSKNSAIDLMVMDFCVWGLLNHFNLPAKNEWNLPHGFGDRHIATAMATPMTQLWGMTSPIIKVRLTTPRMWPQGFDAVMQQFVCYLSDC